jgi:hypothetical protein
MIEHMINYRLHGLLNHSGLVTDPNNEITPRQISHSMSLF